MIVTSDSLRELQEIAAHDSFRMCVRELSILPILFEDFGPLSYDWFKVSSFGQASWPRHEWEDSELQTRHKRYQYFAEDHQNALSCLPGVLGICLPRLGNLDVFKLQPESTAALLGTKEAVFRGCLGLRQFRTQLVSRRNLTTGFDLARDPGSSKPSALVLSALLKAILASNRMVREIHTCAAVHCGVALSNMTVTPTEYKSLLPLIKEAECLHLCPRVEGQKSPSCAAFLDFVIVSANIEALHVSYWSNSGGSGYQYFHKLSGGAKFTRIRELHLFAIKSALDELRDLLRTAAPTLQRLRLEFVTLNDIFKSDITDRKIDEARKLWQQAWELMGDDLSLEFLSMIGLACRDVEFRITDRLSRLSGRSKSGRLQPRNVVYSKEHASISLGQWITGLKSRPFIRSERDRGEYMHSQLISA